MTFGYSPVMIEHLLDEALVWALRRGAETLHDALTELFFFLLLERLDFFEQAIKCGFGDD